MMWEQRRSYPVFEGAAFLRAWSCHQASLWSQRSCPGEIDKWEYSSPWSVQSQVGVETSVWTTGPRAAWAVILRRTRSWVVRQQLHPGAEPLEAPLQLQWWTAKPPGRPDRRAPSRSYCGSMAHTTATKGHTPEDITSSHGEYVTKVRKNKTAHFILAALPGKGPWLGVRHSWIPGLVHGLCFHFPGKWCQYLPLGFWWLNEMCII